LKRYILPFFFKVSFVFADKYKKGKIRRWEFVDLFLYGGVKWGI